MQIPYAELDQTNDESISMVFLMLPKFWSSIAAKCQNVLLQNLTFSLLSWEIFSFKFAFGFSNSFETIVCLRSGWLNQIKWKQLQKRCVLLSKSK